MPIYEYICADCGNHYEQIVLSKDPKISCPQCTSSHHKLQLSVFSTPARSSGASSTANGGTAPGNACCGSGGCGCG